MLSFNLIDRKIVRKKEREIKICIYKIILVSSHYSMKSSKTVQTVYECDTICSDWCLPVVVCVCVCVLVCEPDRMTGWLMKGMRRRRRITSRY